MAFTFWSLLEASLLIVNAIVFYKKKGFLPKGGKQIQGYGSGPNVKSQILNLIRSVRTVMRIPLIFINIVVILMKFVLG
uniref:Immediate early response 3-interacting protein 1 n=1 Tax=Daphnia galeata TaxID=27404 RepID=A0A8J2RQB4_9CRUS|nr:unnamed protein product [Daphnia galeata]